MSIESFSPLPLNVFGTWVTLLDPSDVPAGMSPSLGDVEFFPGGFRTRPGLVSRRVQQLLMRRRMWPTSIRYSVIACSSAMRIREYTEDDLELLRQMHARQGFDYAFPDLRDPIFVSKLVLEDDAGQVVMASLARLTCEMYLLMNRSVESAKTTGNPRESYARLLPLHKAAEQDLLARGLDDAHAWLPPPIAKRFGRRLTALGWVRDDVWTPYCFRLRANQK